jgi:hypothetical protein
MVEQPFFSLKVCAAYFGCLQAGLDMNAVTAVPRSAKQCRATKAIECHLVHNFGTLVLNICKPKSFSPASELVCVSSTAQDCSYWLTRLAKHRAVWILNRGALFCPVLFVPAGLVELQYNPNYATPND